MRRFLTSLLLLAGVATTASIALAADWDSFRGGKEPLYHTSHSANVNGAQLQTQSGQENPDTLYIGYTRGASSAANPWSIKAKLGSNNNAQATMGGNKGGGGPGSADAAHRPPFDGCMWTWDPDLGQGGNGYVNQDSLQGWWPARLQFRFATPTNQPDYNVSAGGLDYGNLTNYAPVSRTYVSTLINSQGLAGQFPNGRGRTSGVVGVWHRDPGGDATGTAPGSNGVTWTPLQGTQSAWCGLRQHGDTGGGLDPLTGNPWNADAASLVEHTRYTAALFPPKFPGYIDQWDQMLYRDIDMTNHAAQNLQVRFHFTSRMSTAPDIAGWFDKDPLGDTSTGPYDATSTNCQLGNYIDAWNYPAPFGPVDSLMVYLGVGEDMLPFGDGKFQPWTGLNVPCGGLQAPRDTIFDPLRRWFGEVLRASAADGAGLPKQSNFYKEVVTHAGNAPLAIGGTDSVLNVNLANSQFAPWLTMAGNKIRLVFRIKTNSQVSDVSPNTGAYNSLGKGAAVLDSIAYFTYTGTNAGTAPAEEASGWGTFEAANSIDNNPATNPSAANAWRSTGKPPTVITHIAKLNGLNQSTPYDDLCGPENLPGRVCSMTNGIITFNALEYQGRIGNGPNTSLNSDNEGAFTIMSPTIQLCGNSSPPGTPPYTYPNTIGLSAPGAAITGGLAGQGDADGTNDLSMDYETFTKNATDGAPPLSTGIVYRWLLQAYPQYNTPAFGPRRPMWGNIIRSFANYQTDAICFRSLPGITGQEGNMKSLGMYRYDTVQPAGALPSDATPTFGTYPDSIRIGWEVETGNYASGVLNSNPVGGIYIDNVSIAILDGTPLPISAEIWNWFQTAFPWNLEPPNGTLLPAFSTSFDTAGVLVKTGLDTGPDNALSSYNVPGDSVVAAASASGPMRMDLVFRILPGPGNYVTVGVPSSGLSKNPQAAFGAARSAAGNLVNPSGVSGSSSFWESYLKDNGEFGTNGDGNYANNHTGHQSNGAFGGGWNPNVWNSARCDTTEFNLFPRNQAQQISATSWMSTYHETELLTSYGDAFITSGTSGKRAALGLSRHKCFLGKVPDPDGGNDIDCIHDPPSSGSDVGSGGTWDLRWVTADTTPVDGSADSGYNGSPTTVEGTKILPDGLFTPGAHIEYFWRKGISTDVFPANSGLMPDTNIVVPQLGERNNDGHRFAGFGALPDRWKNGSPYVHPLGLPAGSPACMLVVNDQTTNADDWGWWSGAAVRIGATSAAKAGAEVGWAAPLATFSVYYFKDPNGNIVCNDPNQYVAKHLGNPGTTWDGYQITAAEDTGPAGSFGARLASQPTDPQLAGKQQQGAPTLEQLNTFYKMILWLSGNLNAYTLGPSGARGSDDVGMLKSWLTAGCGASALCANRGFWAMGDGFVEANDRERLSDPTSTQDNYNSSGFDQAYLGTELQNSGARSYFPVNPSKLIPSAGSELLTWGRDGASVSPTHALGSADATVDYAVKNTCVHSNDVLYSSVTGGLPGPIPITSAEFAHYENNTAPQKAGMVIHRWAAPPGKPWIAMTSGVAIGDYLTPSTSGPSRDFTLLKVLNRVFKDVYSCGIGLPLIPLDVPNFTEGNLLADFVNLRNNPLASGMARIHFGLAHDDRVQIKVFDVTGREVRVLADRAFKAGEHDIVWDGSDDRGRPLARGVYFTQVRYLDTRFNEAKKLTVLK